MQLFCLPPAGMGAGSAYDAWPRLLVGTAEVTLSNSTGFPCKQSCSGWLGLYAACSWQGYLCAGICQAVTCCALVVAGRQAFHWWGTAQRFERSNSCACRPQHLMAALLCTWHHCCTTCQIYSNVALDDSLQALHLSSVLVSGLPAACMPQWKGA